jgi:hypothetical protein
MSPAAPELPGREAEPVVRDVPRIFLSHACEFDWFIHDLRAYLIRRGIRAYVAEMDPQDGRNIDQKTRTELLASDGVILAWTKSAAASPRVAQEYAAAEQHTIPVQLLLQVPGVDRPATWGHREYVKLDIRRTFPPNIFRPFEVRNGRQVHARCEAFAFRCLAEANARTVTLSAPPGSPTRSA